MRYPRWRVDRLTATEFELLRFMMRNSKRVMSKAQILDRVWNYDFGGRSNIVELYVSYLRKKIDTGREPMIHTLRGAGYVLKPATLSAGRSRSVHRARGRCGRGCWSPRSFCSRWCARRSAWAPSLHCNTF